MATAKQIEANRRNARKSTGPKTEAGKARARLNALRHGNRSRTTLPVLPHEDPRELALRIEEWTEAFRPTTALERDLIAGAARLSWTLDRAERAEAARLARRVARAEERAALRRLEEAEEMGGELFSLRSADRRYFLQTRSGRAPAVIVRCLEATAEGCRWLMARWDEVNAALERETSWNHVTLFRLFRLLGVEGLDAVHAPALGAILSACEVLRPGSGKEFWETCRQYSSSALHGFLQFERWREIAPRPGDRSQALDHLRDVIRDQLTRLAARLAHHEEAGDADDHAEAAAFSSDDASERLHRFQSARHRELMRTLDMLLKLRRGEVGVGGAGADEQPRNDANEATAMPTEIEDPSNVTTGSTDIPDDERSQSATAGTDDEGGPMDPTHETPLLSAPDPKGRVKGEEAPARPAAPYPILGHLLSGEDGSRSLVRPSPSPSREKVPRSGG